MRIRTEIERSSVIGGKCWRYQLCKWHVSQVPWSLSSLWFHASACRLEYTDPSRTYHIVVMPCALVSLPCASLADPSLTRQIAIESESHVNDKQWSTSRYLAAALASVISSLRIVYFTGTYRFFEIWREIKIFNVQTCTKK